ncbi:Partner of Y14 and mago [Neolecta irregularis DAH-3]|uniref:Partner of Y14 and mago n=1 Tax=Neolecta irregularis (strain DAH-3) TaxID=1198029 RepID=A0A1U7LS41_NEOID|nr:Partner of Y14 and mago [Neolecta irregularis DAH-3]|eukprot:OLL25490.1 Partner of Y14 and mago [Neolecta irregularis DAH-3]
MSQQSTSGISTLTDGSRIIVPSKRLDGSERKERKVRPGYTPAEDVCHYQNERAATYRERLNAPKPGDKKYLPPGAAEKVKEAPKKKKRSRGKTKSEQYEIDGTARPETQLAEAESIEDNTQDKEKKARNLRKKIRQVQELKIKQDAGDTLIPEQLLKLDQLDELEKQLCALGL